MKVFSISPIGVLNDAAGRILGFFRPVRDLVRRKRAVGVSGKVVILWVSMWPERPGGRQGASCTVHRAGTALCHQSCLLALQIRFDILDPWKSLQPQNLTPQGYHYSDAGSQAMSTTGPSLDKYHSLSTWGRFSRSLIREASTVAPLRVAATPSVPEHSPWLSVAMVSVPCLAGLAS